MVLWKAVAAIIAVAAGGLGVTLSVIVIQETRFTAGQLERDLPSAIQRTEEVIASSVVRADSAVEFLQRTRDRLGGVTDTFDRISREDVKGGLILLEEFDSEIVERFRRAEEVVRSLQSGLQSAGSLMMLLDSLPFVASRTGQSPGADGNSAKSLAADMEKFNESLEAIARGLEQIRTEGRADRKQITRLQTALVGADGELGEVQSGMQNLRSNLQAIGDELSRVEESAPSQIQNTATYIVLFLSVSRSLSSGFLVAACGRR